MSARSIPLLLGKMLDGQIGFPRFKPCRDGLAAFVGHRFSPLCSIA
jgi:hypothetical protein